MTRLWGIAATFKTREALVEGAKEARRAGYSRLDAITPFRVEGLARACQPARYSRPLTRFWVPAMILAAAILGGLTGFLMQEYAAVFDYPMEVAGRPLLSWPAFIPVTFELTVLFAGLAAFFGVLIGNGLPRLHHPVFNLPLGLADQPRFILLVEASDPLFDPQLTRRFFEGQAATVHEIPLQMIEEPGAPERRRHQNG